MALAALVHDGVDTPCMENISDLATGSIAGIVDGRYCCISFEGGKEGLRHI